MKLTNIQPVESDIRIQYKNSKIVKKTVYFLKQATVTISGKTFNILIDIENGKLIDWVCKTNKDANKVYSLADDDHKKITKYLDKRYTKK